MSWFRSLNLIRNMCAHHNRLWNAVLVVDAPMKARAFTSDLTPSNTFYARAVVMAEILNRIGMGSAWKDRLRDLIRRCPSVQVAGMGFPAGWEARPVWI